MTLANPFRYPTAIHVRKHGPIGYSKYEYFRPWLRDEFDFRCVYCLWREVWSHALSVFEIDHFVAQATDETRKLQYANLVYACHNCNKRKSKKSVLDPATHPYGACIRVLESGKIEALNDDGVRLIDDFALDQPKITEARARFIQWARSFEKNDWDQFLKLMGFPPKLPDLENLEHRPKSNIKEDGIRQSWFQRKKRGDLPAFFE